MVGAGRFELPTSWSQTRRPAAGPRPVQWVKKWLPDGKWEAQIKMVSPERVELSSLAPEASTLSVELRGHALWSETKDTTLAAGATTKNPAA